MAPATVGSCEAACQPLLRGALLAARLASPAAQADGFALIDGASRRAWAHRPVDGVVLEQMAPKSDNAVLMVLRDMSPFDGAFRLQLLRASARTVLGFRSGTAMLGRPRPLQMHPVSRTLIVSANGSRWRFAANETRDNDTPLVALRPFEGSAAADLCVADVGSDRLRVVGPDDTAKCTLWTMTK